MHFLSSILRCMPREKLVNVALKKKVSSCVSNIKTKTVFIVTLHTRALPRSEKIGVFKTD